MRKALVCVGWIEFLLFAWLGARTEDRQSKRIALCGAYLILFVALISLWLAPLTDE